MKSPIDIVMFDLDGTLADTGRDLASSVNFTRDHFDLPPLAQNLVNANIGRGVEHLLRQSLPEPSAAHFDEVMRVFIRHYEAHLLCRTVLYPGVREALAYFRGKRRLVVSNKMQRLTVAVVQGLGVAQEFDAIFGADNAAEKKPHPALLLLALEQFNIAAPRAVIVGDSDIDILAGKRAGMMTCGVTYGLGSRADLIAAQPDHLIDDLTELFDYFD